MNEERSGPNEQGPDFRNLLGMRWVWSLGGLKVRQLTTRVFRKAIQDDVLGRAAQLSYFFFLSLFPLMIFGAAVAGLILGSDLSLYSDLLVYLSSVMPASAFEIVRDALHDMTTRAGAGNISLGLVLTLWAGSAGMVAVIEGLNDAYGITEHRPWWKRRLVATALTIVLTVLGLVALALIVMGNRFEQWLATRTGIAWFEPVWHLVHLLVGLAFMLIVFDLIYLFAPNLRGQRWQAILPGSLTALTLWFIGSIGLKGYLASVNAFSGTYGTLGAVIALLLWLYLSGASILLGGEINSEIRNAAATAGASEAIRTRESQG